MNLRQLLIIVLFACACIAGAASDSISYKPDIHGVLRGRWELSTEDGSSRWQVRNARVNVGGRVAPIISYFVNVDVCDRGKFVFLDAWGRIEPVRGLGVQVGQFRMPCGTDNFRGPGSYYFNNRSFIGRYLNNCRAVGAKVDYDFAALPLTVQAGVFNPTSIQDHTGWVKTYAWAGRVIYRPGSFTFQGGFQSIRPDSVRINMVSASAGWSEGRWTAEAEYLYRHYTRDTHTPTNGWNVFASYGLPLPRGLFDTLSFQCRYDGMTSMANGSDCDGEGRLNTTSPAAQRITVGTTLDYCHSRLRAAVRLNYEKYFYHSGTPRTPDNSDRLSAELIIRF